MLNVIVCVDMNNAIGKKGELGFRLPSDLANFKEKTTGNTIVYGSKTLPSMGGKPLPNRENIIISRDKEFLYGMYREYDNVTLASIDYIIGMSLVEDFYICGGGEIYELFMKKYGWAVNRYIITFVDAEIEGADTFFPMGLINWEDFECTDVKKDIEENGLKYSILEFTDKEHM